MAKNHWVTHAEWQANMAVSKFTTVWKVPPPPCSPRANEGGLPVFLFNGLNYVWNRKGVNQNMILQPVLGFGENPTVKGTGKWWSISSWFAPTSSDTKGSLHTDAFKVYPNDVLTGEMIQTNLPNGKCDLVCLFRDRNGLEIPGTRLTVPPGQDITATNVCQLALEVYDKSVPQAYPNVFRTAMVDNDIETGPVNPGRLHPAWVPKDENVPQWGEHTIITQMINPSAVSLCYGFVAPQSITAVVLGPNVFAVYGIDSNARLVQCTITNGVPAWQILGQNPWTSPPTAIVSGPNTVDVFGLAPANGNRDVNNAQWVRIRNGVVSPPQSLGQSLSCNVAAVSINGQVEIFGVLVGGQMTHTRINANGQWTGAWNPFQMSPSFMASPSAVNYAAGKLKVLGLSNDNSNVRDDDFNVGTGQPEGTWTVSADRSMCNPSFIKLSNDRLGLFTINKDGRDAMHLISRLYDIGDDRWMDEANIAMPGDPGGPPVAISTQPDNVDLFLVDRAGGMWHQKGNVVNDVMNWSGWQIVPFNQGQILTSLPTPVVLAAGIVQAFFRNAGNQLVAKAYDGNKNAWGQDQVFAGGDIAGF